MNLRKLGYPRFPSLMLAFAHHRQAAVQILSDHLRREMANLNVRVITLEIGAILPDWKGPKNTYLVKIPSSVMKTRMSQRTRMLDLEDSRGSRYYNI